LTNKQSFLVKKKKPKTLLLYVSNLHKKINENDNSTKKFDKVLTNLTWHYIFYNFIIERFKLHVRDV